MLLQITSKCSCKSIRNLLAGYLVLEIYILDLLDTKDVAGENDTPAVHSQFQYDIAF